MARFRKEVAVLNKVPTASMADIAFLLLIFFMVTTIVRVEEGLPVALPKAETGRELPRRNLVHIWVDREGKISIDDALIRVDQIEAVIRQKLEQNPELVVAFNTDKDVPYRLMDACMEQLKRAAATNVAFNHDPRGGGGE
jgi:biopolymer transport protein ExbD